MKTIQFIILVAASCGFLYAEDFLSGGIFVKNANGRVPVNLVGQSKTVSDEIVIGKTYTAGDDLIEIKTSSDQLVDFQLSNETKIRVLSNSEFRIDAFNQMVQNSEGQPAKIKYSEYLLNFALMSGDAYIVSPSYSSPNTMCVLQTPLVNLELNGGKYFVRASQKFIICYVIEGKVGVFDSKTNKKEEIRNGQMAFIVPFPGEINTMVTSKTIEPGEFLKHTNSIKEVESSDESVIFAVIGGKIVGIKLNE